MTKQYTGRGFAIYDKIPNHRRGSVRIQESFLAGQGPHLWLFLKDAECGTAAGLNGPIHQKPEIQLSLENVKKLRNALNEFIIDAESNKLTEPVSRQDNLVIQDVIDTLLSLPVEIRRNAPLHVFDNNSGDFLKVRSFQLGPEDEEDKSENYPALHCEE